MYRLAILCFLATSLSPEPVSATRRHRDADRRTGPRPAAGAGQSAVPRSPSRVGQKRLAKNRTYSAPSTISGIERSKNIHVNLVKIELRGNSHFHGWWDIVHKDTSIVVVKGAAYKGQSVAVGYDRHEDATIVYMNKEAGFVEHVSLAVRGHAGEQVEIFYYRVAPDAVFEENGATIAVSKVGRSAGIHGDPHWRHVKLEIEPMTSLNARLSSKDLYYHRVDNYTGREPGFYDDRQLGGNATAEGAARKEIDKY